MEDANILKMREIRCSACKLPVDVLAALHADRFENGMTFEDSVGKYGTAEHPLSESGLRRHFARHAAERADSPISEAEEMLGADPAANTEPTEGLDGHAVLEASAKALTEMMDALVREHRTVVGRNPREAERILGVFMKVQAQLQRSLKARDESRVRQQEFRKTIPPIVQRCTAVVMKAILPLIRQSAERLREEVGAYVQGRQSAEQLWNVLLGYEVQLPREVGARMGEAMREALKTEEARARG
jgi:hypothetical protein